jgi:hypothetical protein
MKLPHTRTRSSALKHRHGSQAVVSGQDGIYFRPMVDHLLRVKVSHWDRNLRKLAAKSLRGLVSIDPAHFCQTVLPYLVRLRHLY